MNNKAYYQLAELHGYSFDEYQMIIKGMEIYEEISPFFSPVMTAKELYQYLNYHLHQSDQLTLNFF